MNVTYYEELSIKFFTGQISTIPSAAYSCPAEVYGSNANSTYLPGTFINNIVHLVLTGLMCTPVDCTLFIVQIPTSYTYPAVHTHYICKATHLLLSNPQIIVVTME